MKSQIEMVGLMVLVILIAFAAIFFLRFSISSKEAPTAMIHQDNILITQASNLQIAIVNTPYDNKTIGEAIVDCCESESDCTSIKNLIVELINKTVPYTSFKVEANSQYGECFTYETADFESCDHVISAGDYDIHAADTLVKFKILLCSSK